MLQFQLNLFRKFEHADILHLNYVLHISPFDWQMKQLHLMMYQVEEHNSFY